MTQPEILWSPSERAVEEAQVTQFARQMVRKHKLDLNSYPAFHQWTVDNPETFWSEVWDFCGVIGDKGERRVAPAATMRETRFFPDARLNFAGEFESPRLTGRITVAAGSLNVDRILDRTLFQPYSTEEARPPEIDPIVALNPWERMGLNLEVQVPGTLPPPLIPGCLDLMRHLPPGALRNSREA